MIPHTHSSSLLDSAWYIVIASATRGPDENVQYGAP